MSSITTAPLSTAAAAPASIKITDSNANPAPLGLMCFAMTTMLLSLHNAGFTGLDSTILAMAIFYGGTGQVIAGIFEWKKNNTFATLAFVSYGFFWLSVAGIIVLPKLGLIGAPTGQTMGAFLAVWGLMSLVLFFATFGLNKALQVVFGLLVIAFALLSIGDITENAMLKMLGGYVGIVLALSAAYTGLAQVLNEVYGRVVWPLGPVVKK